MERLLWVDGKIVNWYLVSFQIFCTCACVEYHLAVWIDWNRYIIYILILCCNKKEKERLTWKQPCVHCILRSVLSGSGWSDIAHALSCFLPWLRVFTYWQQVNFEGDQGAALISFSRNSEAASAYHSSEPVFNNRFIKLFWHRPSAKPGADSKPNSNPYTSVMEQKKNVEGGFGRGAGFGGSGVYARLGPVNQSASGAPTSEYDPVEVRWAKC